MNRCDGWSNVFFMDTTRCARTCAHSGVLPRSVKCVLRFRTYCSFFLPDLAVTNSPNANPPLLQCISGRPLGLTRWWPSQLAKAEILHRGHQRDDGETLRLGYWSDDLELDTSRLERTTPALAGHGSLRTVFNRPGFARLARRWTTESTSPR